jgi:prolyl-tRNA editing enzyme YbaK/EbsC (Cys-tRNA(Pro) deacylase)
MSKESVQSFLAENAPDVEVVDLDANSTTTTMSANWGIKPAQVAKTLALRVGTRAFLLVACGDSRLDNKRSKSVFGGKTKMLSPEETEELTEHTVGGVCPFGLSTPLPIYFDLLLRDFDEVVPAAGAPRAAMRIDPMRMAELVGAEWVDVCNPGPSSQ